MTENIIMHALMGSHAYGLDHEGSDRDYLGVYVAPSEQFWGFHQPEGTIVSKGPDQQIHEVGKFVSLLLKANPTVTELLWRGEYETINWVGTDLCEMRHKFLSADYVRNAYFGYATAQFKRLDERGKFGGGVTVEHTQKHARHMLRLLKQGYDLYTTGELTVRLDDPEKYIAFGEDVERDHMVGARMIVDYEEKFDAATTCLPESPDSATVEAWLIDVRRHYLRNPE